MKIFAGIISVILLGGFIACNSVRTQSVDKVAEISNTGNLVNSSMKSQIDDEWKPAIFKGLKIGTAKRQDAINVLGMPERSGKPQDSTEGDDEMWDNYKGTDQIYRNMIVAWSKKSGVVKTITIHPENLSVADAISIFGDAYKETRYEMLSCPDDAGSSRIYESPNGRFKYIEYRSKGIAIATDDSRKMVEYIDYVSAPIGLVKPQCP